MMIVGHFRKQHDHGIPRLGGIAIFVSFTITSLLFSMTDSSLPINYLLTACIILFAMGLKDDLSGVNSRTKFCIQFIVASILALFGHITPLPVCMAHSASTTCLIGQA